MKAYSVTTEHSEASLLVFAASVGRAKALAHHSEWLSDAEFTDLRAKREPAADKFAGQFEGDTVLDGGTPPESRIMRELGWYEVEGDTQPCEYCGLYPWDDIPESLLQEKGDVVLCRECFAKENS